jgi:hypothetical protein
MELRTLGNLSLAAAVSIGAIYSVRDIRRHGWWQALKGTSTPAGSFEDRMGQLAGCGRGAVPPHAPDPLGSQ